MLKGNRDFVHGTRNRKIFGEHARALGFINYNPAPGDVFLSCPYNRAHIIREARYTGHLSKCRKGHLKKMWTRGRQPEFGICRYDYSHHIPTLELEGHESICPGSAQVVNHLQKMAELDEAIDYAKKLQSDGKSEPISTLIGAVNTQIVGATNVNLDDDSWERESRENIRLGIQAYDPQKKLQEESGNIIQSLQGVSTKSERKAFRQYQYEAFKQKGRVYAVQGLSAPTAVTREDARAKRAKDLLELEKMNAVRDDHQANRRRHREDYAADQIGKMIEKTRSESVSSSFKSDVGSGASSNIYSETVVCFSWSRE